MTDKKQEARSEKEDIKKEPYQFQDSILAAIKSERLAQDFKMGPVEMRPMRLDLWMHNVKALADIGYSKAAYGQRQEALRYLLKIAAEAVAALEDRLDAEANKALPALREALAEIETADPAGTESAA